MTFAPKKNNFMLRSEFAKLLDSIIIPEGINQECMESRMLPISDALMSMLPQKGLRHICLSAPDSCARGKSSNPLLRRAAILLSVPVSGMKSVPV